MLLIPVNSLSVMSLAMVTLLYPIFVFVTYIFQTLKILCSTIDFKPMDFTQPFCWLFKHVLSQVIDAYYSGTRSGMMIIDGYLLLLSIYFLLSFTISYHSKTLLNYVFYSVAYVVWETFWTKMFIYIIWMICFVKTTRYEVVFYECDCLTCE
jgi:hypothetical protein